MGQAGAEDGDEKKGKGTEPAAATEPAEGKDKGGKKDKLGLYDSTASMSAPNTPSSWMPGATSVVLGAGVAISVTTALIVFWRRTPASDGDLNENFSDAEPGSAVE